MQLVIMVDLVKHAYVETGKPEDLRLKIDYGIL